MRAKKTYLLFSFFILWLFIGNSKLSAQPYLGVTVEDQEEINYVIQHLDSLQSMGISYVEFQTDVPSRVLETISSYNFTVLLRSDQTYLTTQEVLQQESSIEEHLQSLVSKGASTPNIGGIGVYSNSMSHKEAFNDAFDALLERISTDTEATFYFVKNSEWFSFEDPATPFALYFDVATHSPNVLHHFNALMTEAANEESSQILFMDATWLSTALDTYPQLAPSLVQFKESGSWIIPLPKPETPSRSLNLLVILLILLWAGLAIQMRYLPYIRPMILRYFFAHRFFVDDILHYRERMITASLLVMLKHAIFGGMVAYIASKILLTEVGVSAFFHHFPLLAMAGTSHLSFFLLAFVVILITQVIAILWLHLPAKNLEHISQTLNLYSGLFYLDFVIVTLMLPLFLTQTWPALTLTLSSIYILIWFASFNITAFDASKAMGANRFMYLLLTIGLHLLIFAAILIFLFTHTEITQTMSLSLSL